MKPKIESLHGGWAAVGDGWTAYGTTKGEALLAYRLAARPGSNRRGKSNRRRLLSRYGLRG